MFSQFHVSGIGLVIPLIDTSNRAKFNDLGPIVFDFFSLSSITTTKMSFFIFILNTFGIKGPTDNASSAWLKMK